MNPRTQMQAAFVANAQDTDVFGTEITHRPPAGGDPETVTAVLHSGELVTSTMDDDTGSHVESRMPIELLASVEVVTAARPDARSQFDINGKRWIADAVSWRNTYRQVIIVKRTETASTKQTRVR